MTNFRQLFFAVTLLGLAACQRTEVLTAVATPAPDLLPTERASLAMDQQAQAFVKVMGEAEIYAIEAAQIALVKAGSPQVERLARSRYAHHAASLQTLKLAALAAGAAYPTSLDAKGRERIEALWGAEGPAFDQLFLRQMKAIERETATARGEFLATGRDQYLRRFASAPTPGSGQADVATGPIQRGAVEGA